MVMLTINDFDDETRKKAIKLVREKQKKVDFNWSLKLTEFDNMKIFYQFDYVMGMPKKEFLKRLTNIRPFIRQGKNNEPFEEMLKTAFNKLNDKSFATEDDELRVSQLHKILSILAVTDFTNKALIWLEANGELVGMSLHDCLIERNMYLVTEACYVSSYIVRFLDSSIPTIVSQAIIMGCIDIISARVMDQEDYIEYYRNERIKHEDQELFAGKELPFHWPKLECQGKCREYCAITCALYTIAFVFQFNPHTKIISYFQNQICCRREVVRYLLYRLYLVILKNLNRAQMDSNIEWKKLPGKLYSEIGKALIDKNPCNKRLINEIIHHLQDLAMMKYPTMSMNSIATNEHFKLATEQKLSTDRALKSSMRLVLKTGGTAKFDIPENITDASITEDSDDRFKDIGEYQRKSLFLPEIVVPLADKLKESDRKSIHKMPLSPRSSKH